ncbi:3-hydroxybutyryl-CoA dehydrogenase [Prauserella marina]|uniref:3-hydroxybutyryl-CoA dehydrogenase n=1 Tax=Prauserella marina TaxID=530584 RepID=A0A1G6R3W3_9PSEU|nr:3-hydroxyacyl-CoA dehydrogenase NAD-binding domain-containing protein [Prauserella marina]PWV76860.1 3-hydroxyacyl-CoA dehydrogenase [Prauserella marina]SDC99208.1 3-hydroxybutyryl-CoA dehydrogenase [Prauserella marina]
MSASARTAPTPAAQEALPCSGDRVAVIGAGIMGRGIARAFASAGAAVTLVDADDTGARAAIDVLRTDLTRGARRDPALDVEGTLGRIRPEGTLEAVGEASAVIECVPEDLDLKRGIFQRLAELAPRDALLSTNTSALPITSIASATAEPHRVVGLHFFNPVHRMKLVEVIAGLATGEATVTEARALCERAGKTTVRVTDRAGFVTSRVNVLIGNEAFHLLTEGVADAEEIDIALTNGLNHPMGPFELIDLVGLDTRLSVLRSLHESLGDRFRPDPTLVSLVQAGRLGRKTGHGVYRYDEDGARIPGSGLKQGGRP